MRTRLVAFALFASTSLALAGEVSQAPPSKPPEARKSVEKLDLEAVAVATAWDGPQVVRADHSGRVYFFALDTLEVFPLRDDGKLGAPQRLEVVGNAPRFVREAALGPGGDVWFLAADEGARLFVDGKEKSLPNPPWRPGAVGFLRDTPIASVIPTPVGADYAAPERKGAIPRFLLWDRDRWTPFLELPGLFAEEEFNKHPDSNRWHAEFDVHLASDGEGRLWVARAYAYVIEQLKPSGSLRLRLTVRGGKVEETKEAEKEPSLSKAKGFKRFTAVPAIRDLAYGRDHRMYFVTVAPRGALALDRYEPVLQRLERVLLDWSYKGRISLAAGKDGLYLAAWNAKEGRFLATWEQLDLAEWQEVQELETTSLPEKTVTPRK